MASRMMSTGMPGRVHLSPAVADALNHEPDSNITNFPPIPRLAVEPRGKVFVKGKGEVDTFWLLHPTLGVGTRDNMSDGHSSVVHPVRALSCTSAALLIESGLDQHDVQVHDDIQRPQAIVPSASHDAPPACEVRRHSPGFITLFKQGTLICAFLPSGLFSFNLTEHI